MPMIKYYTAIKNYNVEYLMRKYSCSINQKQKITQKYIYTYIYIYLYTPHTHPYIHYNSNFKTHRKKG